MKPPEEIKAEFTRDWVRKAGIDFKTAGHFRQSGADAGVQTRTLRLVGTVSPEMWNRLGTKIIPKLKSASDLKIDVGFSVTLNAESARSMESDLRQIIEDLNLRDKIRFEYID
jgi:hypothetical protein